MAFLGLGSNVGDRQSYLQRAVRALMDVNDLRVVMLSPVYETVPVGYVDQPPFLNAVVAVQTRLSAIRLLAETAAIETSLGRRRSIVWGPRTIDIDILLFGDQVIATPELTVPHPRLRERAFVLLPLAEIAPDLVLPGGNMTVRALAEQVAGRDGVQPFGKLAWGCGEL